MSNFNPEKLHVTFSADFHDHPSPLPRRYTLTHSDRTGDLFLTIGRVYNQDQISGWYTKLMRDEVLGEWIDDNGLKLHIHLHVSGGCVFGPARWRDSIFKQHLPMTLQAICYGDSAFTKQHLKAPIVIHFHAKQERFNNIENYGLIEEFII